MIMIGEIVPLPEASRHREEGEGRAEIVGVVVKVEAGVAAVVVVVLVERKGSARVDGRGGIAGRGTGGGAALRGQHPGIGTDGRGAGRPSFIHRVPCSH